jgi:hypothetical protein
MIHTNIEQELTISLPLSDLKEIMRLIMLNEVEDPERVNLTIYPNGDCKVWHPSKELVNEGVVPVNDANGH